MSKLFVRGARSHNLRDVDLDLEHGHWHAVTGLSGSGKTSLVFDTLVVEGQRRFLGALSARARAALGKLGRADVDALTGLPPAIALGASSTASPRSTVGTLTGLLDLLRLLFARQATDPQGATLSRSTFSFNGPGACERCAGNGVEDHVDPDLFVAHPSKSLAGGALVPTLKNGYTVYSQVTLEVMDQICHAHGFDVHTPWQDLSPEQQHVILFGTDALVVPFGKHSLESRMKWKGITARPREQGHYRGLVPVVEETLRRSRNRNILRFVRSVPCSVCSGTRLGRPGREARLGRWTLPELLGLRIAELDLASLPSSEVLNTLRGSLELRLGRLRRLQLGHLSLDRRSPTLSGGEAQRIRLATQVSTGLGGFLVAFDEPTLGLHPSAQQGLREVLDEVVEAGNTLVVVEHDPDMVRHADRVVVMGPGAGVLGGRVVSDGPATHDPLGPPPIPRPPREAAGWIRLEGARKHNLRGVSVQVALGALTVVRGPSGAGKSTLIFEVLAPALAGGRACFDTLHGVPEGLKVRTVDARPIGRTPRSTPATWTGLFDLVRARFGATEAARARGWRAGHFSYNNAAGRCPACEGLGFERVGLHLLADVELPCSVCAGSRYAPDTLTVQLEGRSIADVLALTVSEAVVVFAHDPPVHSLVSAMEQLGLGHLQLGISSTTLSRGESQRIKLATLLGTVGREPMLVLLDEPDRGLHPTDLDRLIRAMAGLVDAGHTVVAISHHRHVWAVADHHIALEDGALADTALQWERLSQPRVPRAPVARPSHIRLRGARTHNLTGVDVDLPRGALTVIAGVSGSGKSSLAFDTLAAEAWRRFADTLPFQVRRFVRQLPAPVLDSASGLGPTLALRQEPAGTGVRATVGTQTEIDADLRLLWSRVGTRHGARSQLTAAHFSPNRALGACPACEGRGTVLCCDVDLLVTAPERALGGGALAGTHAGRFFSEASGQHLATLAAALPGVDLSQPWSQLDAGVQRVALHGSPEVLSVSWSFARGERTGQHRFEGTWDGLCALVEREARRRAKSRSAAKWADTLVPRPCEACDGQRLRPEVASVVVGGLTLPRARSMPLAALAERLDTWRGPIFDAVLPAVRARLNTLRELGLGGLDLHRAVSTLSGGELQLLRLATVLRAGLAGLTLVLDEPGANLPESALQDLVARLRAWCAEGHTVVAVSHRRAMLEGADHLVELGPGAGEHGGRVLCEGPPSLVLAGDGPTARALREAPAHKPGAVQVTVRLAGVRRPGRAPVDLELPERGLVLLSGGTGSGKSTVARALVASAEAGRAVGCDTVEGLERYASVHTLREQGETVLDALGALNALKDLLFQPGGEIPKRALSFRSPAGRCPTCHGSGVERVSMDFLADLALPCPACDGARYRPEVLQLTWQGLNAAQLLELPLTSLPELPGGTLRSGAEAAVRVGLGHLTLGRRRESLSGGEAGRLALAAGLASARHPALFVLDGLTEGLHPLDVQHLVGVCTELAAKGDLVVAVEARDALRPFAHHCVDLET